MSARLAALPKWPTTVGECHALLTTLWLENQHLREQAQQNSRNSSRPPSSDGPKKPPKPPRQPGQRPRGGQVGHPGRSRTPVAGARVDAVVDCLPPGVCPCGGHVAPDAEPAERRHQIELPPVRPVVTEFRRYAGRCQDCGRRHQGELPHGSRWCLGPRATALVAVLSSRFHLSKRLIVELCRDVLGVAVAVGTIAASERRVSAAVAAPVAEAHGYVQQQPVVHADETSCPQGNADGQNPEGTKGWLWVAVTAMVTVFLVRLSRGQQVAKELLGEGFAGFLGSDRWSGYGWVSRWQRQLCWAHLTREFTKIAERGGESGRIGAGLLAEAAKLFGYLRRVRDGTLQWSTFRSSIFGSSTYSAEVY